MRALPGLLLAWSGAAAAEEPPAPADPPPGVPVEPLDMPSSPPEIPTGPVAEPAPPRRTSGVTTVFTEDFELRYWQKPDRLLGFPDSHVLDYVEAVNRVTGLVHKGRFSIFGQLDAVALGANTYFLDGTRELERDLLTPGTWSVLIPGTYDPSTQGTSGWGLASRNAFVTLEKLRASYATPTFELRVGDTYAAFGRGLALNINRNVDLDLDTSVQGVEAIGRPGDWEITGLFGQLNRQQVFQDNPNLKLFGDRRHLVAGVRVERHALGPVTVGAHGTLFNFVQDEGWKAGFQNVATTPDVVAGGATVEANGLGPTDWYVEVDGFGFPSDVAYAGSAEKRGGWSGYLSGALYAGPTTWLLEAKRYDQAQRINSVLAPELYQAVLGPTLEYERQITEDSSAAVGSNDVWGTRLRVDWSTLDSQLVPYASIAVFRDLDLGASHFNVVPETIVHGLVGLEYIHDAWAVLLNVGYRHDDRDGDQYGADKHVHGDLSAHVPLGKGFAVDVAAAAEHYAWGRNPVQQRDYVESEQSYSLSYQNLVTLTWFMDYSTNPLIATTGNLTDSLYGAGELLIRPLPALSIRLYYGSTKAGVRCSGGQCRILPGFDGGKLSLTAQF